MRTGIEVVVLPECLLGVVATVEEKFGGQLDTQHA